jgi:aryl-alcohol dehydrogenase-like predicted oxidoreductase
MRSLTRRQFSKLAAAAPLAAQAAQARPMPLRRLGKINFQAGILGFGAQRIGDYAGQANTNRIVAEAVDAGINYIDTAPNYGLSEERLGPALAGRRDKVFLVTKIETKTRAEAMAQMRESLRRMRTDYLDCVHFHNIGRDDRWGELDPVLSKDGALAALLEAKKQGMIRHIGCTTHSGVARVIRTLETGHIDVLMCVLNFVDRHIYNLEERLLPEARKRNIAVVAMKVLGGPTGRGPGARLTSPENYRAAMRYCLGLPGVAVSIVGFRTPEELQKGLAAAREFQPLGAAESRELAGIGRKLAADWGPTRGPVT